jgi:hypothetical protein
MSSEPGVRPFRVDFPDEEVADTGLGVNDDDVVDDNVRCTDPS